MAVKRTKSPKIYVDMISELPDDVLHFILSLLTIKEAVRTGILSQRWRFLWMKCVASTLSHDIDVLAMKRIPRPEHEYGGCLGGKFLASYDADRNTFLLSKKRKRIGLVYQILHLDHRPVKDSFSVRFYLKNNTVGSIEQLKDMALAQAKYFAHNIDKWIKMAETKLIDSSHFYIQSEIYRNRNQYHPSPCLVPSQQIKPSVKFMGLRRCSASSLVSHRFSSLVDIRMKHLVINDEMVTGILSYCRDLEKLFIYQCNGLRHLKISGPSLKLKHFTLLFCWDLKKLEVRANYLIKLHYCGNWLDFMHLDAPMLSEVILRNENAASANHLNYARGNLSSDVPQLESLMISLSPAEEKKITKQLVSYPNLKKLVLLVWTFGGALWGFIPLLQASPYLRKFELHMLVRNFKDEEKGVMEKPCDSPYPYLEEITLSGFTGRPHDIEFATYLLKNSPSLKKMTIFYEFLFHVSSASCFNERGEEEVKKLAAKGSCRLEKREETVLEQLSNLHPPGVEMLFT